MIDSCFIGNHTISLYTYFYGLISDNWDYSTIEDRRSVYNNTVSNQWVQVTPVIPMSTYSVQVNASNTAGYILSNTLQLDMPEGCKLYFIII